MAEKDTRSGDWYGDGNPPPPNALRQWLLAGFAEVHSVIPPGATISPTYVKSRLGFALERWEKNNKRGKEPTLAGLRERYEASRGKVPGLPIDDGWKPFNVVRKYNYVGGNIRQSEWAVAESGANVGLNARKVPGLDVDCTDEAMAKLLRETVEALFGSVLYRVGKAPKHLIPFRLVGDEELHKVVLKFRAPGAKENSNAHQIELLASGQQYVVEGKHPSGVDYSWPAGSPAGEGAGIDALPAIDAARVRDLFRRLERALEVAGCTIVGPGAENRITGWSSRGVQPSPQELLGPPDLMTDAMRTIPNPEELDRDGWLRIGFALKGAMGRDHDEEGRAAWREWSEKWPGGYDEAKVDAAWDGLRPQWIGAAFIADLARENGWQRYSEYTNWLLDQDYTRVGTGDAAAGTDAGADAGATGNADGCAGVNPGASGGSGGGGAGGGAPLPATTTQDGAAEAIVAKHGQRLRYIPEKEVWAVREDGRWVEAGHHVVFDIVRRDIRVFAQGAGRLKRSMLSRGWAGGVEGYARLDPRVVREIGKWDADPWLLMTPGGVVDLRTGEARPAGVSDYMLKTTCVPVAPRGAKAPLWERFLRDAFRGDEEVIRYVQMLFGLGSIGEVIEHLLVLVYGSGGSGKSTLLNTIAWVMGDYATTLSTDLLMTNSTGRHPTELASLAGVRIGVAAEVEKGKAFHVARMKGLTGGDSIRARFMRQDEFTFQPSHTLFMAVNDLPRLEGDEAVRRRLRVITMNAPPKKPNPMLPLLLRKEGPAILRWIIEGALSYWVMGGLLEPRGVQEATDEYVGESDPIGTWARAEVVVTGRGEDQLHTSDLVTRFKQWAQDEGESLYGVADRDMAHRIALIIERDQRAVKSENVVIGGKRARGYRGVRFSTVSSRA